MTTELHVHLVRTAYLADETARKRAARSRGMKPWLRQWTQRLSSLKKIAGYRRHERLDLGPESAWLIVIADLVARRDGCVTTDAMAHAIQRIGLTGIDPVVLSGILHAVPGEPRKLMSPDQVGALLHVAAAEREELGIRDIGSCDETAAERRKRLDRMRKAAMRAANRAASRPPSQESERPWEAEGVCRSTWFRGQAARRVGETVRVRASSSSSQYGEDTPRAHAMGRAENGLQEAAKKSLGEVAGASWGERTASHVDVIADAHSDPHSGASPYGRQREQRERGEPKEAIDVRGPVAHRETAVVVGLLIDGASKWLPVPRLWVLPPARPPRVARSAVSERFLARIYGVSPSFCGSCAGKRQMQVVLERHLANFVAFRDIPKLRRSLHAKRALSRSHRWGPRNANSGPRTVARQTCMKRGIHTGASGKPGAVQIDYLASNVFAPRRS